jgi:hypothetical protein
VRAHFHRFLLILLMLALPLQAFASAAMLGCVLSDRATAEPMAMAGGMMAGCHEPDQPDTSSTQADCEHCAACALASALPVPASDSAATAPASIRFVSPPAASFSGFVPSGPERPPRLFLA